jgi:hypothetical protein
VTSSPGRDAYVKAREKGPLELWISSSSAVFPDLPWELLKDPDRPAPLALELAGLTRTVPSASEAAQVLRGSEIRVLLAIARPAAGKDVRYRIVARPLLEICQAIGGGRVRIDVLRPPTLDAMKGALERAEEAETPYQVVHFDGHGAFGERRPATGTDPHRFGDSRESEINSGEPGSDSGGPGATPASQLLTQEQADVIISAAASSSCGQ